MKRPILGIGARRGVSSLLFAVVAMVPACGPAFAQNIGWEGETGVFVTPLAYTAASPSPGIGSPVVAYHYLNGGSVIGVFHEMSVTQGAFGRVEFGYTRSFHEVGNAPTLSPLWHNGFNIVHGKVNLVAEKAGGRAWVPAISTGFILRTQDHNVGAALLGRGVTNADVYLVATKSVGLIKPMPILLSGGVRGTNAELLGMGGNAPDLQARGFAAVAFVLTGPSRGGIVVGSEMSQEPRHPDQLPNAVIPTTLTYAIRASPSQRHRINLDFGVAQVAGRIAPGVDLKGRACVGAQVSYGFPGAKGTTP